MGNSSALSPCGGRRGQEPELRGTAVKKTPHSRRIVRSQMFPSPAAAPRLAVMACCFAASAALHASGELSLHDKVDALVAAKAAGHAMSPAADDAEFLRRAWLDFDGGIPTAAKARAFFEDESPGKRVALIEKL